MEGLSHKKTPTGRDRGICLNLFSGVVSKKRKPSSPVARNPVRQIATAFRLALRTDKVKN